MAAYLGQVLGSRLHDDRQADAGFPEPFRIAAQLRERFREEDSPALPEPDEERRTIGPQLGETGSGTVLPAVLEVGKSRPDDQLRSHGFSGFDPHAVPRLAGRRGET